MTSLFLLFDRSIKVPGLALAAVSFAATLALVAVSPKSQTHVLAAEHFAQGIPALASLGILQWLRVKDDLRLDAALLIFGVLVLILGGYFCVNGIMLLFGLLSQRAGTLFGTSCAFLAVILGVQLLLRLLLFRDSK